MIKADPPRRCPKPVTSLTNYSTAVFSVAVVDSLLRTYHTFYCTRAHRLVTLLCALFSPHVWRFLPGDVATHSSAFWLSYYYLCPTWSPSQFIAGRTIYPFVGISECRVICFPLQLSCSHSDFAQRKAPAISAAPAMTCKQRSRIKAD